jgi:hypothetical protein
MPEQKEIVKLDKIAKDDAIMENEVYQYYPRFDKMPPYTAEDIEHMMTLVRREHISCTSSSCYSVQGGSGGTACGACCS